jgi:hypothetical protein
MRRTLVFGLLFAAISIQTARAAPELFLFGGEGHKTFLGCLTCSQFDSASVENQFGKGSAFDAESIFNHFSEYGSPYSSESACNVYATDPPVIVDRGGNYYGRLTLNQSHPEIGLGRSFISWTMKACGTTGAIIWPALPSFPVYGLPPAAIGSGQSLGVPSRSDSVTADDVAKGNAWLASQPWSTRQKPKTQKPKTQKPSPASKFDPNYDAAAMENLKRQNPTLWEEVMGSRAAEKK